MNSDFLAVNEGFLLHSEAVSSMSSLQSFRYIPSMFCYSASLVVFQLP